MRPISIRELYEHYEGLLEPRRIRLAIGRLRAFRVPMRCWDETMQELALVICNFRFDPDRAGDASEETILCRMLDNRIRELARSNGRRARNEQKLCEISHPTLDWVTPDDDAMDVELRELLTELTPEQQAVCRDLMAGRSIGQIAKARGRCWYTIERQVEAIRQFLIERGYDR